VSAASDHGIALPERYEIRPFSEVDEVSGENVVAFWEREGAVKGPEARVRLQEVLLVATERDQGLVGVCSAYLQHNQQLRLEMWHFRAFVAKAHRRSTIAILLALRGRDTISARFVSGEDSRAPGIVYEVDSPILRRTFREAVWPRTHFTYIGENANGSDVRVHWFPGAQAPLPDPS
jgi:hypothetical protein